MIQEKVTSITELHERTTQIDQVINNVITQVQLTMGIMSGVSVMLGIILMALALRELAAMKQKSKVITAIGKRIQNRKVVAAAMAFYSILSIVFMCTGAWGFVRVLA